MHAKEKESCKMLSCKRRAIAIRAIVGAERRPALWKEMPSVGTGSGGLVRHSRLQNIKPPQKLISINGT